MTCTLLAPALPVLAQVCAPLASLQTGPTNGIVNTYYVPGNTALAVGATQLTVGTSSGFDLTNPVVGDLLLVVQMQDAEVNTANNSSYGDGTGRGSTTVRNAGLHEFVRVTAATGANVTFTPALQNSYANAAATAASFQRRYQVIRVRQYTSLTANGITSPQWNGQTGGVIAVDVRDTLTLGGGTVEAETNRAFFAAGKGFRGGAGRSLGANNGTRFDYATNHIYHGGKGEGIAGTPRYYTNLSSGWGYKAINSIGTGNLTIVDLGNDALGYPGGSAAQGAPGNGGGGGSDGWRDGELGATSTSTTSNNQFNSGGGGGGNYGPGGIGGRPWDYPLVDSGGRGGSGYSTTLKFNRAFLGGGGGAGGTNNGTRENVGRDNDGRACDLGDGICSSGAPGGGLVILRARNIIGTGIIDVRGAHGYNVDNDAAGGGGAGGSIILHTQTGGNATIQAQGGDGGNAYANSTGAGNRHGPGGGGGGGFVAFSPNTMAVSATVNGGIPGYSSGGDFYDASGYNGGLTTFQTPNTPGVPPAAQCEPNLSLTKTNGVSSLTSPGTTSYSLTVFNTGNGSTSGTVAIGENLPVGLSVIPGALTLSGTNAASWSCTASTAVYIQCTSASTIAGGASSTFAFQANVSATNGTSLINRARVGGGGDPTKSTAPTTTTVAACTANDDPAGCALDTDTVTAPNLILTKTDGITTVLAGGMTTYTLVVTNAGGTPTTGQIRVVDVLPTGLTFSGTGTVSNFVCTGAAQVVTCNRTTPVLAAGASATITLVVAVNGDAPSSVLNLARVGGGGDPSPAKSSVPTQASTTACVGPVSPADTASDANNGCAADANEVRYVRLSLTKDDGAPFMNLNGTVAYQFVVRNDGTAASSGTISLRDVLPTPMNFPNPLVLTSVTPASAWTCGRVNATAATCTSVVSIPAGGSTSFTLQANVGAATAGTQYTNKARIAGGGDPLLLASIPVDATVTACTTDGNPSGCAIDMNTAQSAPLIRMTKSHPDPQSRNPGDTFNFTLRVSNTGGGTAAVGSIQLIDVIPDGLTVNSFVASAGFTCDRTGQVVNCRNASSTTGTGGTAATYQLAAGASRTVTVNVTVAAAAFNNLINEAKTAATGDPQNTTPMTTATTSLAIVSACVSTDIPSLGCAVDPVPLNADLQVIKSQRVGAAAFGTTLTSVQVGGTIQFALDVTNSGPSRATAVQVIDTVPTNFSTVTWSCAVTTNGAGGGTASSCGAVTTGSGNAIALTTGLLRSGAVLRITVNAVARDATDIDGVTNTATVVVPSGIVDGTPTNNVSTVNTRIGSARLTISKSNGVNTVTSGTTTTYTIVVANTGNFPADGALLYDPLVTGLTCTAPPTCVASGPASCPPSLTVAQLQNSTVPTGVVIPTLGPAGSLTLGYTCQISATGL